MVAETKNLMNNYLKSAHTSRLAQSGEGPRA